MHIEPSGAACGARVSGIDLSVALEDADISAIRSAWLEHKVLAFADQQMDDDALERFTLAMGGFGEDPFFDPIDGHEHIAAIKREADETSTLFAENWHSDWSFLRKPPSGTCLMAVEIPPIGGDTLFSDQVAAFAALPDKRKDELRAMTAVHSASRGYAPDGLYGDNDKGRSMSIRPGEAALARQSHPLVKLHPETGEEALFCSISYTVGIEGMDDMDAFQLIIELHQWCEQDRFVYRHKWQPGMLVIWDNRSVNHKATGGYEGHRRELHRSTIAAV
ncbi:alpha-ketoglutarate-dependent taurine dioxygenase [Erythrobacter sp. NAP1]|uniref:TauD/TfdA dioxygenase family protein n=1 Tax=Erythrobacter sp. NAP1 TaxID=237727 RepID=UPI0000686E13|nr:TauD/TfdA family dioxygenase [Erythrobacter sp. NAP1]EAQ30228.1 alpha-ketoglutarate-dependent taurine dioxygenase [Erythrobacter sp. NAP1]